MGEPRFDTALRAQEGPVIELLVSVLYGMGFYGAGEEHVFCMHAGVVTLSYSHALKAMRTLVLCGSDVNVLYDSVFSLVNRSS